MPGETLEYLPEERVLAIRSVFYHFEKPIKETLYWPIFKATMSDAQNYALGAPMQQYGADPGRYRYANAADVPEAARRLIFHLTEGGKTKAIRVSEEPVPLPKVRKGIEVRWHNGRWEKYLRSSGWVIA